MTRSGCRHGDEIRPQQSARVITRHVHGGYKSQGIAVVDNLTGVLNLDAGCSFISPSV